MPEHERNTERGPGRRWRATGRILVLLLGCPLLEGCVGPSSAEPAIPGSRGRAGGPSDMHRSVLGVSVEGRSIEMIDGGEGDVRILLLGTIHGDEPAGGLLLERLARELSEHPEQLAGRRVMIIPVANPDGLAHRLRFNAHGVDLNRNFPARNRTTARQHGITALSEPEARVLHDLILACRPAWIVSIHQPLACIDHDGAAAGLAAAIARAGDLPVRKLGARPGSLGSFAGLEQKIPIVTLELPAGVEGLDADRLWARYGAMLLAALAYRI